MTIDLTGHLKTCRRSHPHEEMDDDCERYTEYERELASLRAEKDAMSTAIEQARMVNGLLTQRAEKAEAERDAALKDAERYRFLRHNSGFSIMELLFGEQSMRSHTDAKLDAAIDTEIAAIAARKGQQ